jgi:5-methylcytosine-specific restriction protein A
MASLPSWRIDKRKTAERGYGGRWQRARLAYLTRHPLCVMCQPRIVLATVVDHKVPHKGDVMLFWDESNWQPLCASHHNGTKQALERSGRPRLEFDSTGEPI